MEKKVIINIGRQFGSGGKDIALTLGRLMGIPVYDKELIIKAAQDRGFSKELFEHMDEKKNFFSIFNIEAENYVNDNGLFKIQSDAINDIADLGSAIIVGRCSDYILRNRPYCIDLFITAPLEHRIERTVRKEGITPEEAENLILKKDRQREAYYNYYTFGNWGMASNYDFCIDSSLLGIEGTAAVIADYVKRRMDRKEGE